MLAWLKPRRALLGAPVSQCFASSWIVYKDVLEHPQLQDVPGALICSTVVMDVLILLFQIASVNSRLAIPSGHPVTDTLLVCRIFAQNLGYTHMDGALDLNYVKQFISGSIFPMLGAVAYLLWTLVYHKGGYLDVPL